MVETREHARVYGSNAARQEETSTSAPQHLTSFAPQNDDDVDLELLSMESKLLVKIICARFDKRFDEKDQQIAKLEEKVEALCVKIVKQNEVIERHEEVIERLQQERIKDTMVISGNVPAFNINEDCSEVVAKALREKLSTNIRSSDIVGATRLGAPKQDIVDKRPIKFKFKSGNVDHRKIVSIACVRERPNIYINELMTPFKKDLFHRVRKIKREAPGVIRSCYVSNGLIVIKRPGPDGRNIKINNQKELERFLQEFNIHVPNETQLAP